MLRFHSAMAIAIATSLSLSLGLFPLSDSNTFNCTLLVLVLLTNGYRTHSEFSDSNVIITIAFAWWKQFHRQQWYSIFCDITLPIAIAQWKRAINHFSILSETETILRPISPILKFPEILLYIWGYQSVHLGPRQMYTLAPPNVQ